MKTRIPRQRSSTNPPAPAKTSVAETDRGKIPALALNYSLSGISLYSSSEPRNVIQPGLKIGAPDDDLEKEADETAERVMRRADAEEKSTPRAGSSLVDAPALSPKTENAVRALRGGGGPLPDSELSFFEPRFGRDFSRVRVHADGRAASSARALNARAYTLGSDIVFGERQYQPGTVAGRRLLAHELTHTLQQGSERSQSSANLIIQRRVPAQKQASDGIFAVNSTAASTVKVGSKVNYSVTQKNPTIISAESRYHYKWSLENDPITFAKAAKKNPKLRRIISGPKDVLNWTLWANFPGKHLIKMDVSLDEKNTSSRLIYEQTVTDSGASLDLIDLISKAGKTKAHPGVKEWTTADILSWKTPIIGDPNYIHEFKAQWVRGYRDVIKAAAAENDLPELLVAGIAYTEVGGDPLWIDDLAYGIRKFDHLADPTLEPLTITTEPNKTSFGNLSIQIRRAAETLGLEPEKITSQQANLLIAALKEPRINIFIAAKHIAELRDIDFKGKGAAAMSAAEIMVTATRYNRGPELSIENIRKNMSYGKSIINRAATLIKLLSD